jgi:hypothetical protein
LHGGACAREEFEVKDDGEAVAAHSSQLADCVNLSAKAVVRRTILEFEFLSRIIASMQSMRWCRHDSAAVSYVFEPGQDDAEAVAAIA